ncbi:hypothetical protein ACSX1A_02715 [Pontibacter sp. MBLB2868]|uniref:hypothetical protein n=1 Tax=Pontibacter sp. MBLB2868 TaxID=3451555 RepID=UPI003F74C877
MIYRFNKDEKLDLQNPGKIIKISFDKDLHYFEDETITPGKTYKYVVTTLDRLKNESAPSNVLEVRFRKGWL